MSYAYPENGRGGPPRWPQQPPGEGGGKMRDITKFGLPLGVLSGAVFAVWALIQISYAAGENVGTYKQTITSLQRDVAEVKADVRSIKEAVADMKAVVKQLAERPAPQWSMAVRPSK